MDSTSERLGRNKVKKTTITFGILLGLTLFAAGCGEEQQPVQVVESAQPKERVNTGDVLGEWRRDAGRFEGGQFSFSHGEETYSTSWGYADFRHFKAAESARLTLLNNPLGGEDLPILRVVISAKVAGPEELIGQTVEIEKINLKLEKGRKSGIKGTGTVTIDAIGDGYIEGSVSAELEDGNKLEATFRAMLNLAEDAE